MHIGFVTTGISSQDGWTRYSAGVIEPIASRAKVTVLVCRRSQVEVNADFRLIKCLPEPRLNLPAQCRIFFSTVRYLRSCDLIHCLVEPFSPGVALACSLMGTRFVVTLHGTYALPPKGSFVRAKLLGFALRRAAMLTSGSVFTEKKVREVLKIGPCRIIPNGVNLKRFRRLPISVPQSDEFIITVGAVKRRKGADITVRALGLLKDEFPKLQYVIVGDVSHRPFVTYLRGLIQESGLSERVQLLGRVSEEELVNLYNRCLALVLAARDSGDKFEGFPMVFFEANACGAPIIATRGFGSEYAIRDGFNGFLIEPEDPRALAQAIRRLKACCEPMIENAVAWAKEHSIERIAETIYGMYLDILGCSGDEKSSL